MVPDGLQPGLGYGEGYPGVIAHDFLAVLDTATSSIETEAEDLNARLDGWQYQIASYKLSQLTRRMSDLLKAQSSADQ